MKKKHGDKVGPKGRRQTRSSNASRRRAKGQKTFHVSAPLADKHGEQPIRVPTHIVGPFPEPVSNTRNEGEDSSLEREADDKDGGDGD